MNTVPSIRLMSNITHPGYERLQQFKKNSMVEIYDLAHEDRRRNYWERKATCKNKFCYMDSRIQLIILNNNAASFWSIHLYSCKYNSKRCGRMCSKLTIPWSLTGMEEEIKVEVKVKEDFNSTCKVTGRELPGNLWNLTLVFENYTSEKRRGCWAKS